MRIGFFSTALVLAGCGDKTVSVRNAIPEAVITSPASGYAATETEELTVEGYAGDADDEIDTLNARWLVNGSEVCAGAPDSDGTTNCTFTVEADHSEITLIVVDPSGGAGEDSISISVSETSAPEVAITSPEEGESFATGVLVELSAIISDAEDDPDALSAVWTSSLDTDFSLEATLTGTDGAVENFTDVLIAGEHALTLTVTDTSGKQTTDSVLITVVDPNTNAPEVVINSPSEGDTFRVDDTIRLAATLSDVEDDNDTLSAVWTSSGDPDFELVPTPNTEGDIEDFVSLPEGEHALTITVTDSDGQEGTASVLINVRPPNEAPSCDITAPESGASAVEGTLVSFEATIGDDDPVDGLTIEWLEDGTVLETSVADVSDGSVTFATSDLSPGTHNITLQVTDADGDICTDDVVYTVGSPPTVNINHPVAEERYYAETLIELSGIAEDPEDDEEDITIAWTTSAGDDLTTLDTTVNSDGTFSSFTELSEGEHALVVTATDTTGLTSEDTVIITVGAPNSDPTCAVTSPSTGDEFTASEIIYIEGTAEDEDEDASALGVSFSYASDEGAIELGSMSPASSGAIVFPIEAGELPTGTHVITMSVIDEAGGTCSDNVIVTVVDPQPPTVVIDSPEEGASFVAGATIVLEATVSDEEDAAETLSAVWTVSSDDTFSEVATPDSDGSITTETTLEPGEHTLTLTVTDSDDLESSDTVSITVEIANEAPRVAIESPSFGDRYYADQLIDFAGTATDAEDDDGDLLVAWSSTDEAFGFDATVLEDGSFSDAQFLPEGEHTLTVTATDTAGLTDEAEVTITVGPENSAPICEIISPEGSSVHGSDDSIIFEGTASDTDQPDVELDVVFSYGPEEVVLDETNPDTDGEVLVAVDASVFSLGTHVIKMTVTDEVGAECVRTVAIQVGGAPTVAITAPDTGAVFNEGEAITFTGLATDEEDEDYTLDILWSTDRSDDPLNTDAPSLTGALSFSADTLEIGEHAITLTATDEDDQSSSTTVYITINDLPGAPVVAITPENPASTADLTATVTTPSEDADHDEADLSYTFVWTKPGSDDEVIGETLPGSVTAEGDEWTVTVTPADPYGSGDSATASVTINSKPNCSLGLIDPEYDELIDPEYDELIDPEYDELVWSLIDPEYDELVSGLIDPEYDELIPSMKVFVLASATDADESADGLDVVFSSGDTGLASPSPAADGAMALLMPAAFDEPGEHTITMVVTDAQGETCEASTTFQTGGAPVVDITSPDDSVGEVVFNPGDSVSFSATATDDRDTTEELTVVWASDLDGELDTAGTLSFSTADLSLGTHTITVTVEDTDEQTATDSVVLRINAIPSTPSVSIAPDPPTSADPLVANPSSDDADGDTVTYAYEWTKSGGGGVVSTDRTLSSSETSAGETWTVTVTASDPYGSSPSETADVTINTPPSCAFTSPSDGGIVPPGSVTLVGLVDDVDEDADGLVVNLFDEDGTALSTPTPDDGVFELTVGPFEAVGEYTFDMLVTDALDEDCEATVTFEIGSDGVADYLEGTPYDSVAYHSAEMDTANDRVLLYGGQQYHQLSNGLSAYSLTGDSWTTISTVMDPGERMGHATAMDNINNKMYVFGGQMYHHLSDELLVFDTVTNEWSFPETADHTGSRAPPLTGASMVLDEDGQKLHIFGGQGYHGLNDEFWTYDIATDLWDSFVYDSATGPVAAGMAAGFDPKAAEDGLRPGIVFGGQTYHQLLNTGWCFDATGFSELTVTGVEGATLPPAVGMASTWASNYGGIVAFGGQTYYQLLDDAYLVRMVGDCEVEVRLLEEGSGDSPAPPPIVGGAMAWSPDDAEAFLVGGQTYYELSDRVTGIAP